MPPFLPRKRLASTPPASPQTTPVKRARLADALDAQPKPSLSKHFTLGEDDSDSSLSDVESDEFEDALFKSKPESEQDEEEEEEEEEEDDDEVDWEDATGKDSGPNSSHVPMAGGDIQLTFRKDDDGPDYSTAAASGKKGPTKKERESRLRVHTMHVQFLLFHNAVRNNWICDKTVQDILVQQLPSQIKEEVQKWRRASGLVNPKKKDMPAPNPKDKKGKKKAKTGNDRNERDWGIPSQRLEVGTPDLSKGEPLIPLLRILSAYWKKRFSTTVPGLRKRGYGTKAQLKNEIVSYRNDEHDPERHGERIRNLQEFREVARGNGKNIFGSRDVGAQLFTALCRGLGIESRLVASLQPSGFGWSKTEQMNSKKVYQPKKADSDNDSDRSDDEDKATKSKAKSKGKTPKSSIKKGGKSTPIDLDSDADDAASDSDSIIDIAPSNPKAQAPRYDRDLPFPIYWTEAISPISHKVLPVSPLVVDKNHCVASTAEQLIYFEPRGGKAEKAKQIIAYVVAYSIDGSAKDVTTRYLKRRTWPGKTKGMRIPVEKVPVYDKNGKIKRHEEYDWFKHAMSGYVRTEQMRTAVDDVEESSDLVPQQPEKKKKEDEGDTLQSLKSSSEWVLERNLRREEALLPDAKPDRTFISGKPDTASYKEEPVYRRQDVVRCQTAESWHKVGRRPIAGQIAMKHVPVRAVTLARKREAEDHQRTTGQKQTQGLYSEAQTEYIIPPPIRNGVIPKNSYGNIDCFVPSMVPQGAVHIPLRATGRICKKLEVDYAEAVVGFEFGNKMAVPVIQGVVIAAENEDMVRDAWKIYAEEQRIKEDAKLEKRVRGLWRKMVLGLRIRERVEEIYGGEGEEMDEEHASNKKRRGRVDQPIDVDADEDGDEPMDDTAGIGGGFLLPHEDDIRHEDDLVMEYHDHHGVGRKKKKETAQYPTPDSASSTTKKASVKAKSRRSLLVSEDSDEESEMAETPSTELSTPGLENGEEEGEEECIHDPEPLFKSKSKAKGKASAGVKATPKPNPTPKSKPVPKNAIAGTSTRETTVRTPQSKPKPITRRSLRHQDSDGEEEGESSPYFG